MSVKRSNKSVRYYMVSSPVTLAIFSIVPLLFLLSRFTSIGKLIPLKWNIVLAGFVCLFALIAVRFVWGLLRLRQREPAGMHGARPSNDGQAVSGSVDLVAQRFRSAGFLVSADRNYGEKGRWALLGTTLCYGFLLVAVSLGIVDDLRQFSNVVLLGAGSPMVLDNSEVGLVLGNGLYSSTAGMPQLKVVRQILPDKEWPDGASEIALLSKSNVELARKTIAWGQDPLKYGGYEYHMGRFIYDIGLTIASKSNYLELGDYIRLVPKKGLPAPYTHAALFKGELHGVWTAMYDPQRKALRLILRKGKVGLADGEMIFQKDLRKDIGGFVAEFSGMGTWSEIHIVRSRHIYLVVGAGIFALLAGLFRLFVRPQRYWLEEGPDGCKVWGCGNESLKIIAEIR